MDPLLKKAYWALAGMGALYFVFLGFMANPWIQSNALYMQKLKMTWRYDLTKPEQFGFASSFPQVLQVDFEQEADKRDVENQVTPFYLDTADGEKIFAWHVLPLGLYKAHRDQLVKQDDGIKSDLLFDSENIKLLMNDPEARLIIHFHGNTGTVGAGWRPTYLRSLSAADPSKIHILGIDYRGFGLSTGTPTEEGLITDGLAAVDWAINTIGMSPSRIALIGQSLGTAVTFGVAERLATNPHNPIELGAVITIAAFSNMKDLVLTYSIGGVLPILSPLRPYPFLQNLFSKYIYETWKSDERVVSLIKASKNLNLILLHAYNDFDIPWSHCDALFYAAANATLTSTDEPLKYLDVVKLKERTDYGAESYRHRWPKARSGGNSIEQWIVTWGGHNQVVTSAGTSVIVAKALGL